MIDLPNSEVRKIAVLLAGNNTSTIRINSMITIFQTTIIAYMIVKLSTAPTRTTTARAL